MATIATTPRSSTSNLAAAKRLRKEWANLQKSATKKKTNTSTKTKSSSSSLVSDANGQDPDIFLLPHDDNILQWMGLLRGPDDTPYEGGVFQLSITCSTDYPLAPPTITFITRIFHPNVHFRTGDVCLDILKKEWSPAWGIQAACRAILALLSDPDPTSPLNCDAGNMLRNNADIPCYISTAHMYTVENAMFLSFPTNTTVTAAASAGGQSKSLTQGKSSSKKVAPVTATDTATTTTAAAATATTTTTTTSSATSTTTNGDKKPPGKLKEG